jgi:hypothetical protein
LFHQCFADIKHIGNRQDAFFTEASFAPCVHRSKFCPLCLSSSKVIAILLDFSGAGIGANTALQFCCIKAVESEELKNYASNGQIEHLQEPFICPKKRYF